MYYSSGTLLDSCSCSAGDAEVRVRVQNEPDSTWHVLATVAENPRLSVRQISQTTNLHFTTVHKILKKNKYNAYKLQIHQELRPGAFAFQMMEKSNDDRDFLSSIIFTDESSFTLHNEPNTQNNRMWASENPHRVFHGRTQYPEKVNVWAGILGNNIIGPFFIDGNLTGERFLQLLIEDIGPAVAEVSRNLQTVWFQMDGCPAHNYQPVREFLNESFNGNVISTHGTIQWPARSPDLAPNDFFLWGHLKSKIYTEERIQSLDELRNRIRLQCAAINRLQFANVRREFYDRLGHCLTVDGDTFEQFL